MMCRPMLCVGFTPIHYYGANHELHVENPTADILGKQVLYLNYNVQHQQLLHIKNVFRHLPDNAITPRQP